ncbi:MAG: PqqD family protein [Gemmatimonadaceae bacterium]
MNRTSIVSKAKKIPAKELEGEMVLLNLENGDYVALNEPGMEIWKLLEGEKSVEELARELAKVYSIPATTALKDALTFLGNLQSKGFIEVSS